ncbi:NAD(P)-dependent oxidoreductase [Demequina flava]|uniref:NAD(P)-dependent oxidoreductase n=1 Tax=Demequina flava TaxID=1095025 RepID=UPI000782F197|nr:NAD(P)H-binding protein [Demequina flava]
MTTIALFGATGKTGSRVLTRLLDAGYEVRALARDASKLPSREGLTSVQGDVQDATTVSETVAGADAVLSLFGHVKGSSHTLQTDGTRHIVEAMKAQGISRIVTLSGGGLGADKDQPGVPDKIIRALLKLLSGHLLSDAEGHVEVLEASGLDWTVVRAPRLTENPGVGSYRVSWVGVEASTQISRDDLADFIVKQIDDRSFVHQMPFVSA